MVCLDMLSTGTLVLERWVDGVKLSLMFVSSYDNINVYLRTEGGCTTLESYVSGRDILTLSSDEYDPVTTYELASRKFITPRKKPSR
jgi:hypothetical protein